MKCVVFGVLLMMAMSPPSRGAWIEIDIAKFLTVDDDVAPLAGGVD